MQGLRRYWNMKGDIEDFEWWKSLRNKLKSVLHAGEPFPVLHTSKIIMHIVRKRVPYNKSRYSLILPPYNVDYFIYILKPLHHLTHLNGRNFSTVVHIWIHAEKTSRSKDDWVFPNRVVLRASLKNLP